jgi:hypothetical protein
MSYYALWGSASYCIYFDNTTDSFGYSAGGNKQLTHVQSAADSTYILKMTALAKGTYIYNLPGTNTITVGELDAGAFTYPAHNGRGTQAICMMIYVG